ncbi:MAG: hypothetical protein AB8G05_18775 [Oligoflexales bacterium]
MREHFISLQKKYGNSINKNSYLSIFSFIRPLAECRTIASTITSPVFFVIGLSVGSAIGVCTTSRGAKFGFSMPVAAGLTGGLGFGTASLHTEKNIIFIGKEGFHKITDFDPDFTSDLNPNLIPNLVPNLVSNWIPEQLSSKLTFHTNTAGNYSIGVGGVPTLETTKKKNLKYYPGISFGLGATLSKNQGIVGTIASPFWDFKLVDEIALAKSFPKIEREYELFLLIQDTI